MADLQFQDFHGARVESFTANGDGPETTYEFQHSGDMDRQKLIPNEDADDVQGPLKGDASFLTFEYYQQLFNVDTDQVLNRLFYGMVPRPGTNFITEHIRPFPDLYGPFWICVTLVFTTAICGNLATYLGTAGVGGHHWQYDFRMVTVAATAIFGYVVTLPAILYAVFWYRRSAVDYTYLEILCCYGYSLAVFVPVSMLWTIQYEWFRWALICVAVVLSGTVLVFSFWSAVQHEQKMIAAGIIFGILFCHSLLAIGFKEYFFDAGVVTVVNRSPVIRNIDLTKTPKVMSVTLGGENGAKAKANASRRSVPGVRGVSGASVPSAAVKVPLPNANGRSDTKDPKGPKNGEVSAGKTGPA